MIEHPRWIHIHWDFLRLRIIRPPFWQESDFAKGNQTWPWGGRIFLTLTFSLKLVIRYWLHLCFFWCDCTGQSSRIKQSVCLRQSENVQLSLDFFSFFFCSGVWRQITQLIEVCSHVGAQKHLKSKISQELRMLSSVTLYCQVTMTVMLWGSQNGRWEQKWLFFYCLCLRISRNFESRHLTMFDCWALAKSLWHLFWSKVWFSKLGKTLLSIIAAVLHRKMRKTFYAK